MLYFQIHFTMLFQFLNPPKGVKEILVSYNKLNLAKKSM